MTNMNILIIGNGFDLAHYLPTSYMDFMKLLKSADNKYRLSSAIRSMSTNPLYNGVYGELFDRFPDLINKLDLHKIQELENRLQSNVWGAYYAGCEAEINGWIDFEREMIPVFEVLEELFNCKDTFFELNSDGSYVEGILLGNGLSIKKAELLYKYFKSGTHLGKQCIIVRSEYCGKQYGVFKDKILKDLKKELDVFIELFKEYLEEVVGKIEIQKDSKISSIKADAVISFNYTTTELKYENLKNAENYHVHGSVSAPNSIVMGINGMQDDYKNTFLYFYKYFQRIRRRINPLYHSLLSRVDEGGCVIYPRVIIYGHSLDSVDEDILKEFIKNAEKVVIYYYNEEDYENKIINLIKMFNRRQIEEELYRNRIEFSET